MRTSLAIVALALVASCQYNPYAHWFTTTKPKDTDVAGSYLLTHQRITSAGLSILRGQQCQLNLHGDGSFQLTNYPAWGDAYSSNSGHFTGFISTTGRWTCAIVGVVSDGHTSKDHWGVVFSDTEPKLESFDLTGEAPPYGLIMTYGDPDSGTVLIFDRKKASRVIDGLDTANPADLPLLEDNDFTPALGIAAAIIIVIMVTVCLFLLGVGLAVGIIMCAVAGALTAFGILSSSVAVAFLRRSPLQDRKYHFR